MPRTRNAPDAAAGPGLNVDPLDDPAGRALEEAIVLFNTGDYFTCHEVLEGPWRAASGCERDFFKGLIHAAVSLYQYRRANAHGARVKAASCRRYLTPFLPARHRLDLGRLLEDLDRFIAPLHSQAPRDPPPIPTLPWPLLHRAPGRV